MYFSSRIIGRLRRNRPNTRWRPGRVEEKSILVTGAGRGLGSAIARLLASEGAQLLLTDVDADSAEAVAQSIRRTGRKAHSLQQDISSEAQWNQAIDAITEHFGGLDVLVNNAGIAQLTDIDTVDAAHLQRMLAVNVEGTYYGMLKAIAAMKAGKGGSIVNVSSVGGIVALPGLASYCSTKAAIRQLTKSVALECARKSYPIRVNAILPGFVPTPNAVRDVAQLTGLSEDEAIKEIAATIPLGRPGTPEEIAYGVLFLASEESSFMTGTELVMDGGVSAG